MTSKIQVLFMQSQSFFGADSQIHASIMTHLPRDRFDVHCAVPRHREGRLDAAADEVRSIGNVHVKAIEFGPSLEYQTPKRLAVDMVKLGVPMVVGLGGLVRYVRKHHIDIIHCTEKPRDAIYGTAIARLGGAKSVIHVHVKAENWIRPLVRKSMHRADALIGVSDFVAGSIVDLGYDPARVHSVLNGLELDKWIDPVVDHAAVRSEFAIGSTAPMLVTASRLYHWKGQHELLRALPLVTARYPDLKLLIVGEDDARPTQGGGSYTAELRRLTEELDLRDNVIFTGWRHDVRSLMVASDLFVMPSFEEPFGMVWVEAMSLRRPVVALNNGGTKEVVDHGGSGLLSEPGDTAELAANIVRLLDDPGLRRRMGEHGRQRVIDHLDSVTMTKGIAEVYEHVMAGSRPD